MTIPCKECIGFAICKQKIRQMLEPPDLITYSRVTNCISLYKFMHSLTTRKQINEARSFYDLPNLRGVTRLPDRMLVFDKSSYENHMITVVSHNNDDYNYLRFNKKDC